MSTNPEPQQTGGYEFNDEQNRTFTKLAESMGATSTLLKLFGLVCALALILIIYKLIPISLGYSAMILLGLMTLGSIAVGFWISGAANSFRRVTESKNRDIWHLMNALDSLYSMFSLFRTLIQIGLIVAAVAAAIAAYEAFVAGRTS